jgi:hypothetical protein
MNWFWVAFVGGLSGSITTSLVQWLKERDRRRKAAKRWRES